jgi:taurine---2-oxoglutarate transaminase
VSPAGRPSRLLAARQPLPPLPYSHARGSWVYAPDGRRYLDASSGLVCVNIGHSHPVVAKAMADQATRGTFASPGSLLPRLQEELALATAVACGRDDDFVSLTTTGTAAVENAIALARIAQRARGERGRHKVLTASLGYHGNSAFALALSGHRRRRPHIDDGFGLGPAFDPPYPDLHHGCAHTTCEADCAGAVRDAIIRADPDTVAAVLVEPVNGTTGGGYVPPAGYLNAVRAICARYGVLLIHDEVLTGLPLAAQHSPGGEADLTVVSKGLGAGYAPLAAVLVAPAIGETILASGQPLPMAGTMSANPLQARVGLAVLSVLRDIGALDRSRVRGASVAAAVHEATRDLPVVKDVRGRGYFIGVELAGAPLVDAMAIAREHSLLLYPFNGFRADGGGEGVIVAPPLTASDEELAFLGTALRTTLERLSARRPALTAN